MSAQDTQDGNIEISEDGDGMLAIHFAWLWEHLCHHSWRHYGYFRMYHIKPKRWVIQGPPQDPLRPRELHAFACLSLTQWKEMPRVRTPTDSDWTELNKDTTLSHHVPLWATTTTAVTTTKTTSTHHHHHHDDVDDDYYFHFTTNFSPFNSSSSGTNKGIRKNIERIYIYTYVNIRMYI